MGARNVSAWAQVQDDDSVRDGECSSESCIDDVVVSEVHIGRASWSVFRSIAVRIAKLRICLVSGQHCQQLSKGAEMSRSFHTRLCGNIGIAIQGTHLHDAPKPGERQHASCIHAIIPIGEIYNEMQIMHRRSRKLRVDE